MHWSTRSSEEIFALFISIAFCVDASKDTIKSKYTESLYCQLQLKCDIKNFTCQSTTQSNYIWVWNFAHD
jgi:sodium borate transporter 11